MYYIPLIIINTRLYYIPPTFGIRLKYKLKIVIMALFVATKLQPYNSTALQLYSPTALQLYSPTALQHYSSVYSPTTLQPCSFTPLHLYNATALELYNPGQKSLAHLVEIAQPLLHFWLPYTYLPILCKISCPNTPYPPYQCWVIPWTYKTLHTTLNGGKGGCYSCYWCGSQISHIQCQVRQHFLPGLNPGQKSLCRT
jgi:hypothetical protein